MTIFVVEIKVRAISSRGEESRSFRQEFTFGDNPEFFLAGEMSAIEQSARYVNDRISHELLGSNGQRLILDIDKPLRA